MAGGKGKGKPTRSPKGKGGMTSSRSSASSSTSKENNQKATGRKSDLLRKQEREKLRLSGTGGESLFKDVVIEDSG